MLQAGHRTGRRACAAGTAAQCPWAQAGACEAGPSRSDSAGAVPAARGHKCPPLPSGTVRIEEDSRTDSISRLLYGRPINLTPSTPARRRRAPARRPTAEAARSARCWRDLAARFEGRRPLSVDNGSPTSALPTRVPFAPFRAIRTEPLAAARLQGHTCSVTGGNWSRRAGRERSLR